MRDGECFVVGVGVSNCICWQIPVWSSPGSFCNHECQILTLDVLLPVDKYSVSFGHLFRMSTVFFFFFLFKSHKNNAKQLDSFCGVGAVGGGKGRSEKEEGKSVWVGRGGSIGGGMIA